MLKSESSAQAAEKTCLAVAPPAPTRAVAHERESPRCHYMLEHAIHRPRNYSLPKAHMATWRERHLPHTYNLQPSLPAWSHVPRATYCMFASPSKPITDKPMPSPTTTTTVVWSTWSKDRRKHPGRKTRRDETGNKCKKHKSKGNNHKSTLYGCDMMYCLNKNQSEKIVAVLLYEYGCAVLQKLQSKGGILWLYCCAVLLYYTKQEVYLGHERYAYGSFCAPTIYICLVTRCDQRFPQVLRSNSRGLPRSCGLKFCAGAATY